MKVSGLLVIAALSLIPATKAAAQTTVEQCSYQCWTNYQARASYCYNRHGGNTYEAEWCMLNEYDAYYACVIDCETGSGLAIAQENGIAPYKEPE